MSKHEKAVFNTLARELTTHFAVANALVDDIAVRCSCATLGGVPPFSLRCSRWCAPSPLAGAAAAVGRSRRLARSGRRQRPGGYAPHAHRTGTRHTRHAPRRCTPSLHYATHSSHGSCLIASLFHIPNVQTDGITAPDPEAAAAAAAVAAAEAAAKAAAGSGIRGQGKSFETEEVLGLAYLFIHSGAELRGKHGPAHLADQPWRQAAEGPRVAEAQGCPAPESASVRAAWKKRIWPK